MPLDCQAIITRIWRLSAPVPKADGFLLVGKPMTPGFDAIVQPGAAVSVMLMLEDGQVAFGDCTDVILSGVAGRDPLFRPKDHEPFLTEVLPGPLHRPSDVIRFRDLGEMIETPLNDGKRIHTALTFFWDKPGATPRDGDRAPPSRRGSIADEYGCTPASVHWSLF